MPIVSIQKYRNFNDTLARVITFVRYRIKNPYNPKTNRVTVPTSAYKAQLRRFEAVRAATPRFEANQSRTIKRVNLTGQQAKLVNTFLTERKNRAIEPETFKARLRIFSRQAKTAERRGVTRWELQKSARKASASGQSERAKEILRVVRTIPIKRQTQNIPGEVYQITEKSTGRVYIGQTVRGVQGRFNQHFVRGASPSGRTITPFDRYLRQQGKAAFTVKTIAKARTINELNRLEKNLIKKFDALNPKKGFNRSSGWQSYNPKTLRTK